MMINIPDLTSPDVIDFIKELHEIDTSHEIEIEFVFNTNRVDPYGLVLGCSSIKNFRENNETTPMKMKIGDSDAAGYAGHMGFFKYISELIPVGNLPGQARGNDNYVPITVIDFEELYKKAIEAGDCGDMNDTIESEAKRLSKVLCHSDINMQRLFTYIIREMLRNTPEHSESSRAIICAQYWKNGEAQIAILDEGIGIKNSLRNNVVHKKYIKNDLDALESAVKPGISQAFSPDRKNKSGDAWSNSGFGLYMASEICKSLQGEFWILSGEKALRINSSGTTEYDTFFNGTAIGIKLNLSNLKDSQSLIAEVARAGEEKAKNIRNAFQNASEPSKSLLMR